MSFCTKCGRSQSGTTQFCTSCGTPIRTKASQEPAAAENEAPPSAPPTIAGPLPLFPPPSSAPPPPPAEPTVYPPPPELAGTGDGPFGGLFRDEARAPASQYPSVPPPPAPDQEPARPKRTRVILIVAVVIVVLAGGGVGAWAAIGGKKNPTAQPTHSAQPTTTAPSPSPPTTSAAPTPTPTPTPSSSLVAAAPGLASQADEQGVLNFLTSYFTAINQNNYQQYFGLHDAQQQQGLTQGAFNSGYRMTKDSAATLTSLTPAGSGILAAAVSFTSHQPASGSPTGTTCTKWNITLYLRSQGGSYTIGAPPSSYHAAYSAC